MKYNSNTYTYLSQHRELEVSSKLKSSTNIIKIRKTSSLQQDHKQYTVIPESKLKCVIVLYIDDSKRTKI